MIQIPATPVRNTTAADSAVIASASAMAGFVPAHKSRLQRSAPGSPTVKFTRIFAKNTSASRTGRDLRIHSRSPSSDSETQAVLLIGRTTTGINKRIRENQFSSPGIFVAPKSASGPKKHSAAEAATAISMPIPIFST